MTLSSSGLPFKAISCEDFLYSEGSVLSSIFFSVEKKKEKEILSYLAHRKPVTCAIVHLTRMSAICGGNLDTHF